MKKQLIDNNIDNATAEQALDLLRQKKFVTPFNGSFTLPAMSLAKARTFRRWFTVHNIVNVDDETTEIRYKVTEEGAELIGW